jgi:hypothetical protein
MEVVWMRNGMWRMSPAEDAVTQRNREIARLCQTSNRLYRTAEGDEIRCGFAPSAGELDELTLDCPAFIDCLIGEQLAGDT